MLNSAPRQKGYWVTWNFIDFGRLFHENDEISWNFMIFMIFCKFHDFMKKCEILEMPRFPANLAPRIHGFLLEIKAILHVEQCRCPFYEILWNFMKFREISRFQRKWEIMFLHNIHEIHQNAPGPQEHCLVPCLFRCFAAKKCARGGSCSTC